MSRDYSARVDLSITVSTRMDAREPVAISITVHDRASSLVLVDIPLDAEQLVKAISGLYLGDIPAWVNPSLDRIGKRMEHASFEVPRDVTDGHYKDAEQFVSAWAAAQPWVGAWETVEPRRTNAGWTVIVRRWTSGGAA